jgi:excisionase family DNA binding protein
MMLLSEDLDSMLGPTTAASRVGISTRHLLRLADDGEVSAIKTPLGRLFPPREIEELRERRAKRSKA